MTTPHRLRPELGEMPLNMLSLPVDERGYPIPWFVATLVDGSRDFRVMDARKRERAHLDRVCWVCGSRLGANFTFVVGPMCAINSVSAEPPSHKGCAEWSVRNCPFLVRPHMVRRANDLPEEYAEVPGMIPRNPGVTLAWTARSYKLAPQGDNYVFVMGKPTEVSWWREGRAATHEEARESMESGLPKFIEACKGDGRLLEQVQRDYERACQLMPARAI